jgi:hypothetical protein
MKRELIYVELKTGFNDNGPAWIGNGFYNRTRKTVYFNGHVFCRGNGVGSNHFDLETGEEYWISGIKKRDSNRHWAGSGAMEIDESVVEEYLALRGWASLPRTNYVVVKLNNEPAIETSMELKNQLSTEDFTESLRFKEPSHLTDSELSELIDYYQSLDVSSTAKKNRKHLLDKLNSLIELRELRQKNRM